MITEITFEEALTRASQQLQKKMQHSVELLRKAERLAKNYDKENGYYLAFSGGKDSQALIHIAQLAGVQFAGHMNLTSVDPPEVIRFVKKTYPEVELIKPKDSIFNIAIQKQILPTMRVRWCCEEYKETAGAGKVTLIGIRHEESTRRAKRNEVEINSRKFSGTLDELDGYRTEMLAKKARRASKKNGVNITNADEEQTLGCISGKESLLISPIIDWTERDVWEFLNDVVCVPHCELYDEGWRRLGCIGCPMSSPKHKREEERRWPHVKRNWLKAIKAIRRGGYSKENIFGGTSSTTQCSARERGRESTGGAGRTSRGLWAGFSSCSSPDRLTDEQEDEIAENIYDWWTSGKGYKQWFAEKFLQQKIDFSDDGDENNE